MLGKFICENHEFRRIKMYKFILVHFLDLYKELFVDGEETFVMFCYNGFIVYDLFYLD